MKRIALLGSTGSIGTQALDVVSRDEKQYAVTALTAGKNARLLEEQVRRFRPRLAVLGEEKTAWELKGRLADTDVRVAYGEEGLLEAASMEECGMVLNALVGVAGLSPTVAALEAGHPDPGQQGVFGVRRRPGDGAGQKEGCFHSAGG